MILLLEDQIWEDTDQEITRINLKNKEVIEVDKEAEMINQETIEDNYIQTDRIGTIQTDRIDVSLDKVNKETIILIILKGKIYLIIMQDIIMKINPEIIEDLMIDLILIVNLTIIILIIIKMQIPGSIEIIMINHLVSEEVVLLTIMIRRIIINKIWVLLLG